MTLEMPSSRPLEFVKADYLLLVELPQDAQLPLAAYQPQGKFDRTALHGVASPLSIFLPAKEKLRTCTFSPLSIMIPTRTRKGKGYFKMEIQQAIEIRRSIRAYGDRPVEREKLEAVLRRATRPPSSAGST